MTVSLNNNFFANSRGLTFEDSATVVWSFNSTVNQITAIATGAGFVASVNAGSTDIVIGGTSNAPTVDLSSAVKTLLGDALTALQPITGLGGSFTYPSITVNANGQITAISSGAAPPTGANPAASVGLVAANGNAATFLRSDGAPALSQAIAPTWTSTHTFSVAPVLSEGATTYSGATAATPSGTAVTLQTLPTLSMAVYLVSVGLAGVGDVQHYSATAVVSTNLTATEVTILQSGSLMTIGMAGLAVQATQNSGGSQPIAYSILRIA